VRLFEFQLPKNKWEMLISNGDKQELGGELIDLVSHAYATTPAGSFVKSIADVIPSDWRVIDWDQDPDVDATVFYRSERPNETWKGYKIQGLGHDGQRVSKDKAIQKVQFLLSKSGWWIESSHAVERMMKKLNVPMVTDERLLKVIFKDPKLKMNENGTYTRKLTTGQTITETVFGQPVLK